MVLSSSKLLCRGLSIILFALVRIHSDVLFVAGVSLRLTRSHEIRRFLKGPLDKKDGKKPLRNVQDIRPPPPVDAHSSSSNHGTSAESIDTSSTSSGSQNEKSTSSASQNEKSGHSDTITEKTGNGIGFLVGLGAVAGLAIAAVASKVCIMLSFTSVFIICFISTMSLQFFTICLCCSLNATNTRHERTIPARTICPN